MTSSWYYFFIFYFFISIRFEYIMIKCSKCEWFVSYVGILTKEFCFSFFFSLCDLMRNFILKMYRIVLLQTKFADKVIIMLLNYLSNLTLVFFGRDIHTIKIIIRTFADTVLRNFALFWLYLLNLPISWYFFYSSSSFFSIWFRRQ